MPANRMNAEEEALFRSYPYALYFVQSPSAHSHANESAFHSPLRSENFTNANQTHPNQEVAQLALSRYSSSRGSNNSFLHEKKIAYDDVQSHVATENGENRLIIVDDEHDGVDDHDEGDDDEDYFGRKEGGLRRYVSFRTSSSLAWFFLQISWRLVFSLGIALLVFYIATKPPPPKMSIKMGGIREFRLGEGVDTSGVTTKVLTCNCSMELLIDNKSKLFGLHIDPPLMEISFGKLPIAITYGARLYAYSSESTSFQLYGGTRNKPMYGAGRYMQDMLESGGGLPLVFRVGLKSSFRVVPGIINPNFHHQAECFVVVKGSYDKKHRTQKYNSTCTIHS